MKLRLRNGVVAVQLALLAACAHTERANTLASLRKVQPDTTDVRVDNGLEKAVDGYRQFLQETPASELTPEAMRRLADLQLEKEYGVRGTTAIVVDRVPSATAAARPRRPSVRSRCSWPHLKRSRRFPLSPSPRTRPPQPVPGTCRHRAADRAARN